MDLPNSSHVVVGSGCYSFDLWWEYLPCFTQVVLEERICGESGSRVGEEDGGISRFACYGSQRKKVEQLNLQLRVQDVSSGRGNPPTLPDEASIVETEVRGRVGTSFRLGRGGRKPFLNSPGDLGLGSGGFFCRPTGLGLGEAHGQVKELQVGLGWVFRSIALIGLKDCSERETSVGFGLEGVDVTRGGVLFGEEPLFPLSRA